MLHDCFLTFTTSIYRYLVNEEENVRGLLIKRHTVHLKSQGDFSFPNTTQCWQEFLEVEQAKNKNTSLLKCINKDIKSIIDVSQAWEMPISKCVEIKDRVHIFLNRPKAINIGLTNACKNNLYILKQIFNDGINVELDLRCSESDSITDLRSKYLMKVIRNLCTLESLDNLKIVVTSKSFPEEFGGKAVFVGTVLNAQTGTKENIIKAEEFVRLRQDELTLIAQHKYGVRVSSDDKWREFLAHLGESAVAFELLQTKCSSPVKIQFEASGGSSKGAAFVLYNCARLETMIRSFDDNVKKGIYPPLPNLENTDLSLLVHEEEWCLIFIYIMGLPSLLRNCVEVNERKCEFRPHLICNHLNAMVKLFSQYYRRVRILTEPRTHLLPVMFARIHMVKILSDTLKTCLRILNIKSVSQMYCCLFYFISSQLLVKFDVLVWALLNSRSTFQTVRKTPSLLLTS